MSNLHAEFAILTGQGEALIVTGPNCLHGQIRGRGDTTDGGMKTKRPPHPMNINESPHCTLQERRPSKYVRKSVKQLL